MGLITWKDLTAKIVDAPTYSTFDKIVISIATHSESFVVACVCCTPGSCCSAFCDAFLFFVVFYHPSLPLSSSVETSMSMYIQIVLTKENFSIY